MKKLLGIIVLGLFLSVNTYAEDVLTVNSLLKEGFKITKEELVKNSDSLRSIKILTLKKGNSAYALCKIFIPERMMSLSTGLCVKP